MEKATKVINIRLFKGVLSKKPSVERTWWLVIGSRTSETVWRRSL